MSTEYKSISVLLINFDDIARAGLESLLAGDSRFTVVGATATDGVPLARRLQPRLILLDPDIRGEWNVALIGDLIPIPRDHAA